MEDFPEGQEVVWKTYDTVGTDDILQQGDLIKFSHPEAAVRYGIVVTADCDLDRRKHSRLVTLVPLLTVEEVICSCLAHDAFEHHRALLLQFCRRELSIEEAATDSRFMGKLKALLREGSVSEKTVRIAASVVTHAEQPISIADIRLVLEAVGVTWKNTLDRFRKQIDSRGDLLRLTKPPLIDESVTIVWLRSMWQERVSSIAIRTSEASGHSGIRVAKLGSPFRYRLTQMLGQVFSDIGLPDLSAETIENEFIGLDS